MYINGDTLSSDQEQGGDESADETKPDVTSIIVEDVQEPSTHMDSIKNIQETSLEMAAGDEEVPPDKVCTY